MMGADTAAADQPWSRWSVATFTVTP